MLIDSYDLSDSEMKKKKELRRGSLWIKSGVGHGQEGRSDIGADCRLEAETRFLQVGSPRWDRHDPALLLSAKPFRPDVGLEEPK